MFNCSSEVEWIKVLDGIDGTNTLIHLKNVSVIEEDKQGNTIFRINDGLNAVYSKIPFSQVAETIGFENKARR